MTRAVTILAVLLLCQLLVAQGQPSLPPYAVKNAAVESIPVQPPPAPDPLRLSQAQLGQAGAVAPHRSWRGFWAMTAAATALTVADIELSQSCLQQSTCSEANPLLPRSRGAAYAIQLPLLGAGTWFSYHLKKHNRTHWWGAQVGLIVGHAIGTASGVRVAF